MTSVHDIKFKNMFLNACCHTKAFCSVHDLGSIISFRNNANINDKKFNTSQTVKFMSLAMSTKNLLIPFRSFGENLESSPI